MFGVDDCLVDTGSNSGLSKRVVPRARPLASLDFSFLGGMKTKGLLDFQG